MKRFLIYLSFALLFLLGSSGQIQAVTIPAVTTIDTTPAWDGINYVFPFGYPNTQTYGQVVTVPTNGDSVLQSFSFYMNLPNTCTFRGYVYAWDGTKATGSLLYEGPTRATQGSGNFEEVHFETGGIALSPGAQYVIFASTSKDTGSGIGSWGASNQDVYPGNPFVFLNNGTDTSEWTTVTWSQLSGYYLAFKATFVKPTRKILYWVDGVEGIDYMGEALANVANTYSASITTATDLTDFESKVAAGGWDLVVLMLQNALSFSTPHFNTYVSKGGRAILADWTKDAIRGALFGVTYTGNDNQDVITIMDDLLLDGVTNPMSLTNPGWGTFSMAEAGTTTGIVAATFPNRDAAIVVGAKGKTIINGFLSDTPASASDGVTLFENEILSLLPLTVTSANGGERVPAGGTFNLTWIPGTALGYSVYYSTKGAAFKLLTNQYGNAYEWSVPLQTDNQPNCMIKVVGYGVNGVKVSQDQSDRVFTIEVVKQVLPNGGETWKSGNQYGMLWTTNGTMGTVANVQLSLSQDGGKTWKTIHTLTGNPGTYLWTVPTLGTVPITKCKVKVVLQDAIGKTLGSDVSDGYFTIEP